MAVTFIKVTEEEQIEKIAEIAAPIWHETYDCINGVASTDYMIEKFQSVPAIHRQMESEGYVYYMMLDDGVPAGFIGLVPHKEGKMFLSKLYVSAAHRSRGLPRAGVRFHRNALSGGKTPRNLSHRQQKEFSRHRSLQILRFSSNGRRRHRHRQRLRDERLHHAERPVIRNKMANRVRLKKHGSVCIFTLSCFCGCCGTLSACSHRFF